MEGGTQVIRRRSLTLSDQLSMVNHQSTNLRDLLKLPDSSDPCSTPHAAIHSPHSSPGSPWRTLRDLLHLHPTNANPNQNPSPTAIEASDEEQPVRVSLMALLEEGEGNQLNAAAAEPQSQQDEELVRVSLMALLEQSERNLSFVDMGGGEDEDEEEEHEHEHVTAAAPEEGPSSHVCCVCMVRQKGAAFIPCGHTFCRRCSRELHMGRGTCPLCNGAITEVLDIF